MQMEEVEHHPVKPQQEQFIVQVLAKQLSLERQQ